VELPRDTTESCCLSEWRGFRVSARIGIFSVAAVISAHILNAATIDVNCSNRVQDTAALRDAIASSRNGDSIRVHGVCLVNRTIVLAGNRSYEGDSRTGTIIRQADGVKSGRAGCFGCMGQRLAGYGDPVRVAHLTLDGNARNNF
jgi:hypothetical protein